MTEQQCLDLQPPAAVILPRPKIRLRRTGAQLRDAGIAQVLENAGDDWRALYRREFEVFLKERGKLGFIGEEFRQWFLGRGNPKPRTPHAWGGAWNAMTRSGLLEDTGTVVHMREPGSHSRRSPVWRAK